MSLSFFAPSRTVLMISDDALHIFTVGARGVSVVDTVPWGAENFEQNVATIISRDCGGRPVLLLNDMVEQHYRKEKIPRVSVLDKANVVQRKLMVAFPNYPVRAALPLKEKIAKTDKSLAGSVYIFAAIPASEAFARTMGAARRSLAPVAGFCLLPVESSDMLKKLSEKLAARSGEKSKARWTVFIGQHQSGGLRQIVTKNGELALTRMTPVVEYERDPVQWSAEVHQEFNATMSYLSRFGYDPDDGLNVILVSDSAGGELVQERVDTPCNFYALTAAEAASFLGFSLGRQEAPHYADVLHVAWSGRKSKFILPMKAKEIDKVSRPRQVAAVALLLMILAGGAQCYQFMSGYQVLSEAFSDIEDSTQRKAQLDLQYQKEVKRKEDLGFDIQLIQSALAVYDQLEEKRIKSLGLFLNVGIALGRDMRIDRIEVEKATENKVAGYVKVVAGSKPGFTANMQMTFPGTTDAEKGNAEVKAFQTRLQTRLPDHVVKISKLLEDYEYSEGIVVETGDIKKDDVSQDYVAEIRIEGPVQ